MTKKRLPAFDIAKAIAIIAVIVGHTAYAGVPASIVDFCYSFHMPLFFLVSGYFCKVTQIPDCPFVKKNAKALLLPYLWTSIILVALIALRAAFVPGEPVVGSVVTWTTAALYGSGGTFEGMPDGIIGVGAIWYLMALFWAKILLAAANQTKYPAIVVLALFAVGFSTGDSFWLPWSIQPAFCAVLFLYAGQVVRERRLLDKGGIPPILWGVMLFAWLYCGAFYGQLYMVSNTYQHGLIDIIGGISGALCIVKGSEILALRIPVVAGLLEKLGKNTLPVFCMHLVELNVVPWQLVLDSLAILPVPLWISVLCVRVVLIVLLCILLWMLPKSISGVFFLSRKR